MRKTRTIAQIVLSLAVCIAAASLCAWHGGTWAAASFIWGIATGSLFSQLGGALNPESDDQ